MTCWLLSIKLLRGPHSTSADGIRLSSNTDRQIQTSVQTVSPPVAHWQNVMNASISVHVQNFNWKEWRREIILKWTPKVCTQHLFGSFRCTRWLSSLRHCATSREFVGSIPDGVTGILHLHNPSCRTMALGSNQLLREISTRNTSWGVKVAGG